MVHADNGQGAIPPGVSTATPARRQILRLIDTAEGAKRLARVILSDIELYNKQKLQMKSDMKPELEEGLALFRSRVAPELVPLFSEVVADRWPNVARSAAPAPVAAPAPAPSPPRTMAPAPVPRAAVPAPSPMRAPEPPAFAPAPMRAPEPPAFAPAPMRAPEPVAAAPAPVSELEAAGRAEAAKRLARVMVSSIRGGDRDDGGPNLAGAIAEARALFRSCVLPELAPLFEDALAAHGLVGGPPAAAPRAPAPPVMAPPPVMAAPPPAPPQVVVAPAPLPPPIVVAPPAIARSVEPAAPTPITFGDNTEPTPAPFPVEEPLPVSPRSTSAHTLELPTIARPPVAPPLPPPQVAISSTKMWLAVVATAVAAASAGLVYYLVH